jgi:phospholipase D1/2
MRKSPILKPGHNCWRMEHADRVSLLVDGAEYFHAFRETAKNARHSVLIIGWDIDGRFELEREHIPDGFPTSLRRFLNSLVKQRKQLQIHVLDWDFAMLFATDREWLPAFKPEIVVILPQRTVGWLSQLTMDVLRERVLKRLYEADHHDRLRVYFPYVPGLDKQCINVHAKVLIIDDELLRVGSANFNNRSMGLDTECDLAIDAGGEIRIRNGIADMRNRLIAEHLDVAPSTVAESLTEHRSLIRTIESLGGKARTLRPFEFCVSDELDALVPEARIADPEFPLDGELLARQIVTDEDSSPARRSLITLASVLIIALLLAAGWRWTPLGDWIDLKETLSRLDALRGEWIAPLVVILIYIVASLAVFPITLLIIATGVTFGAGFDFFYALLGAEVSALVTYAIGQALGSNTIGNLSNRWVSRVSRRLARQGLLAIITLRVVPVAPFTVINLVAGASHIRFRDYAFGTLLGMAPGAFALTLFSDQVVAAIASPEMLRFASLLILAIIIGAATWWLSRWLLRRQQHGTGFERKPGDT